MLVSTDMRECIFLSLYFLQVRAYFTVIAPSPCPPLSGLCAPGEDCLAYDTPLPLTGTKPSDWCVRQWQKTVPSNYSATISLGYETYLHFSFFWFQYSSCECVESNIAHFQLHFFRLLDYLCMI